MGYEFARATTAAEIEAVQRLRYAVYVEEMKRYDDVAGAEDGRFAEPEDEHSWICYARDGSEVVAATRMTWGGDGFSDRQVDQFQLAPFLAELPAEVMGIGERNTVLPSHRGSGVLDQLMAYSSAATNVQDLRVVFGCCEPHLLSLYLKMGQRTYAPHNINSPAAGYLIPLVSFVPDAEALRGVGPATAPGELPACVETVLARGSSVRSEVLSAPEDYWSEIRDTLDELDAQQISTFDGFTDDEAQRCVARSTIIECAKGDRVLKRGGTARNIARPFDNRAQPFAAFTPVHSQPPASHLFRFSTTPRSSNAHTRCVNAARKSGGSPKDFANRALAISGQVMVHSSLVSLATCNLPRCSTAPPPHSL